MSYMYEKCFAQSIVTPFACCGQDPICVGPCLTCMIRCDSAKEVYDGSLLIGFVAVLLPVKNFSISLDSQQKSSKHHCSKRKCISPIMANIIPLIPLPK